MREVTKRNGFSLIEMMMAFAIIVIIFAAIVPQFRAIRSSWTGNEAKAEIIQNGRILAEHITRSLAAAKQIVSVTPSSITFWDNNDVQKCYMLADGYVVFGSIGSEAELAGPVDRFEVKCYSLSDLNTPTTDANIIRLVQVETDFPNDDVMGTDKTFTASVYLQTNANTHGLVGWWKLDETSGTTAADSSGSGNNGTLVNGPTWTTTGLIGDALTFDGANDHVTLPIGSVISSLTNCTIATWVNWIESPDDWQRIWDFGTGTTYYMYLTPSNSANQMRFAITRTGSSGEEQTTYTAALPSDGWHHVAVTIDAANHIHKLYLDGNSVAQKISTTLTPSSLGTTTQNYLGKSQYTADPYFYGSLDDVRIYDRVLTAAEIAQLANTLQYKAFNEAKAASDSNTSVTISTPATNSGDLLIAAVSTDGDTSATIAAPGGQGWTLIDRGVNGSAVTLGAWWKIAGSSEPASHAFTWTGGQQAYGWMMRFSGHDPANPINGTPATADLTSSTPTSPAVTTTVGNCLILRLGAFDGDDGNTLPEPGYPGLSGHTAITMDESASSGEAVSILGSWRTGLSHTRETGTNRALIFIAHGENSSSMNLTSVTYSGRAMTKVIEKNYSTSGTYAYVAAYILNEVGVAAATSGTFVPTWSSNPNTKGYASGFFQNVNQTTLVGASASNGIGDSPRTITTAALSTSSGDMVIDAATSCTFGSYTLNNGFTEGTDQGIDSTSTGVTGYKAATGANETPSATYNGDPIYRQVLIGFVIKGGVSGGTVSGGAGWVSQATAGLSSGTPTFTLGSANEARMITIAIAPDSNTSSDDEIEP